MDQVIIVVEGKSDTAKLKQIFPDIRTVETSGTNIPFWILKYLAELSQTNTILIFTDPDYPGMQIRQKVSNFLKNNCQHAFLYKKEKRRKKIGVAEATVTEIKEALANKVNFSAGVNNSLSWSEYQNTISSPIIKQIVCDYYHFPKINNKTLWKWLNYLHLTLDQILLIIKKEGNN